MAKLLKWWRAHRPSTRRLVQLYAALLYNANLRGFIRGEIYTGGVKNLCVPGFNCYSCPGAIGACPLGALQNALASSGHRAPFYILGMLMLFGLTLGRMICGFLCPVGLLQELAHKLPTPKLKKSRLTRALSWLKYAILGAFVLAVPLYYAAQRVPLPAFCKYICPAGTLEGGVGLLSNAVNADKFSMLGPLFTRKWVILIALAALCVFVYRAFCRFICPLGAIYGLFSRVALFGVKLDGGKCTACGACVRRCGMDIRHVGDHECIHCGTCVEVCPTGAISWKHLRADRPGRRRGRAAWLCALAVLALALGYFNFIAPDSAPDRASAAQTDAEPTGIEVGMRAPALSVTLYGADGAAFSPADALGKIVVINFWATWCTPCIAELPHFQRLCEAYPQDVAMVAVHSQLVTEDVAAYLEAQPYTLPFALDADGTAIAALGGSTMLPMTVVLDREGRIVYNQVGSVSYEKLEALVRPLL